MPFPELTIAPPSRRRAAKSRAFRARLLGYLTADTLWEFGTTASGALRPVWLAYFASVGETKPFTANLRAGSNVRIDDRQTLQLPKSSGHRWMAQQVPGGVATIAYLPELFHLEPPVPFADDARFVMAPSRAWVNRQAAQLEPELGADARDAARAALFGAFLDRRTPLPLLRHLLFHLQIYRAAREESWLAPAEAGDSASFGLAHSGLDAPLICSVDLAGLNAFLTRETSRFHRDQVQTVEHMTPSPNLDLEAAAQPQQLTLALPFKAPND